jgi:hypothetical protein
MSLAQSFALLFATTCIFFMMTYMVYDSESIKAEYPTFKDFLWNLPKFLSGK